MAIEFTSDHQTPDDPCAFTVHSGAGAAKLSKKRDEYFGRVRMLPPTVFERITAQPDHAHFRNLLKLIGAEMILRQHQENPLRPITRAAMAAAFQERTGADYTPFVSQNPDWCRFTGRHMLDVPNLGTTAAASAATTFLVLRDYATGVNPHADPSLRFAMTEEGLFDTDDPLHLAPAEKHPAITAGLIVREQLSA